MEDRCTCNPQKHYMHTCSIKVVVDRKWWLRGDNRNSCLLRPEDGKMCCMGFWCLIREVHPKDMLGTGEIGEINDIIYKDGDPEYIDPYGTLYRFNDDPSISDTEREKLLIEEGKRVGIDFSFEN